MPSYRLSSTPSLGIEMLPRWVLSSHPRVSFGGAMGSNRTFVVGAGVVAGFCRFLTFVFDEVVGAGSGSVVGGEVVSAVASGVGEDVGVSATSSVTSWGAGSVEAAVAS